MRKLTVGLIAVALLATAAPARAQWADPLGLIASGLVIPYVGNGTISPGSQSWLEVYAPVGDESGFHMFFFDSTCARKGDSVGLPLSTNDVELLRVDNLGGGIPNEGLIAAADVDNTGFNLVPMQSAVHARMLWVNGGTNTVRVLEPISIWNPETVPAFFNILANSWNPLRSAATFFAPLDGGALHTTIYFICPTTAVTNDVNNIKSGAFPIQNPVSGSIYPSFGFPNFADSGFPPLLDQSGQSVQTGTTPLRVRVYNDDERFLRDVTTTCSCLTASPVTSISAVYGDAVNAPLGTYSEVEGNSTKAVPPVCDFTTLVGNSNIPSDATAPACAQAVGTAPPPGTGTCGDGTVPTSGLCTQYNLFKVVTPAIPAKGPSVFTSYRAIVFGTQDVFGRNSNGNQLSIQGTGIGVGDPSDFPFIPGINGLGSFDFFNPR